MTHDPMCPQYDCWLEGCTVCDECALIARVREDERASSLRDAQDAIESEWTEDPSWDGTNWNNALCAAKEKIGTLVRNSFPDREETKYK